MLKCKINPEFNIYNIEQAFDKNINFNLIVTMTYAVLRRNVCIKF